VTSQRRLEAYPTKEDLKEALKVYATKDHLKTGLEDAKRHALVLHEDLKGQLGLIAEHLADVMSRLPPRPY
jgi:hypothetical protein